jgi:hypothetical protein
MTIDGKHGTKDGLELMKQNKKINGRKKLITY